MHLRLRLRGRLHSIKTIELEQKIDGGREYKNFIEVIQGVKTLTFTLKIDDLLFRDREKDRLNFSKLQEKTLREIADVCRHWKHIYS